MSVPRRWLRELELRLVELRPRVERARDHAQELLDAYIFGDIAAELVAKETEKKKAN